MKHLHLGLTLVALSFYSNMAAAYEAHHVYHIRKNTTFLLGSAYSLHPDCTLRGKSITTITSAPKHGVAYVAYGKDYPAFKSGPYVSCNKRRISATLLWYRPRKDYVGDDTFSVHNWYPSGDVEDKTLYVTVE